MPAGQFAQVGENRWRRGRLRGINPNLSLRRRFSHSRRFIPVLRSVAAARGRRGRPVRAARRAPPAALGTAQPRPQEGSHLRRLRHLANSATGVTLSRDGQYVAYTLAPDGRRRRSGRAARRQREGIPVPARRRRRGGRGLAAVRRRRREVHPGRQARAAAAHADEGRLDKAKADKVKAEDMPKAGAGDRRSRQRARYSTASRVRGVHRRRRRRRVPRLPQADRADTGRTARTTAKTGTADRPKGGGKGGGKFRARAAAAADRRHGADRRRPTAPTSSSATSPTKTERTIPDVTEFSLSNDEKTLVYSRVGKDEEKNGVYAMNPRSGTAAAAMKTGPGRYSGLTGTRSRRSSRSSTTTARCRPRTSPRRRAPAGAPAGTRRPPRPPTPPCRRVARVRVGPRREADRRRSRGSRSARPAGFASLVCAGRRRRTRRHVARPTKCSARTRPGMKQGWTLTGGSLSFSQDGTKLYVNTAPKREPRRPPAGPTARRTTSNSTSGTGRTRHPADAEAPRRRRTANTQLRRRRAARHEAVPPALRRGRSACRPAAAAATGPSAPTTGSTAHMTGYGPSLSDYAAGQRPHRRDEVAPDRLQRVRASEPLAERQVPARLRRQGLVHASPCRTGRRRTSPRS